LTALKVFQPYRGMFKELKGKKVAAPDHNVSAQKMKKKTKKYWNFFGGGGGRGACQFFADFRFSQKYCNPTPAKRDGRLYEVGP